MWQMQMQTRLLRHSLQVSHIWGKYWMSRPMIKYLVFEKQTCSSSFWKGSRSDPFFRKGSRSRSFSDHLKKKDLDQDPWAGLLFCRFSSSSDTSWLCERFRESSKDSLRYDIIMIRCLCRICDMWNSKTSETLRRITAKIQCPQNLL